MYVAALVLQSIALLAGDTSDGGQADGGGASHTVAAAPTFVAAEPSDIKAPSALAIAPVQSELNRLRPRLNACVAQLPTGVSGDVRVSVGLTDEGRASGLVAHQTGPLDQRATRCVLEVLREITVPAEVGATTADVVLWLGPRVYGSLDKGIIRSVVRANQSQIRYCYERQLVRTRGLKGKVIVRWGIAGNGTVTSARIVETTLDSEPIESCLLARISSWRFPKPKGGGVVIVTYPFIFRMAPE